MTYKSHRTTRAGSATLLVEANTMSEALADAERVASWIGCAKNLKYHRVLKFFIFVCERKLFMTAFKDTFAAYEERTDEEDVIFSCIQAR